MNLEVLIARLESSGCLDQIVLLRDEEGRYYEIVSVGHSVIGPVILVERRK